MKNLYVSYILITILSACASAPEQTKSRFATDGGQEEILVDGEVKDLRKIEVRNTKSLEHLLNVEQAKREGAQKWARFWEEEYHTTKRELEQARIMLGLPAERPSGCRKMPCAEDEVRPSMTITEEIAVRSRPSRSISSQQLPTIPEVDAVQPVTSPGI